MMVLLLMITVVPYILGSRFISKEDAGAYMLLFRFTAGWTVLYGLFYLPALICNIIHTSLSFLTIVFLIILAVTLIFYLRFLWKEKRGIFKEAKELLFNKNIILPSILVLIHSFVTFFMMHIDDDDFAYVGTAATTVYTDTLMVYNGGTGALLEDITTDGMNRLIVAPQYAFYAFLSRISGIRAVTICHTILPPVFTVIFFIAFLMIARELYGDDRTKCGLFLIFCFVIYAFSGFSTWSQGSFVMLRSWQGKAQIVGLILPMILSFCLKMLRVEEMTAWDVLFLTALLAAASLQTAMGAVLSVMAAGLLLVLISVMKRNGNFLVKSFPAFIIPMICSLLYLKMR